MRPKARAMEPKPPRDVLWVCEPPPDHKRLLDRQPLELRLERDDHQLSHFSGGTTGCAAGAAGGTPGEPGGAPDGNAGWTAGRTSGRQRRSRDAE